MRGGGIGGTSGTAEGGAMEAIRKKKGLGSKQGNSFPEKPGRQG